MAFVTLPAPLRNEGTAIFNLIRSLGGAIGISVMVFLLTQNIQRLHAALGATCHALQHDRQSRQPGTAHADVAEQRRA